MKDLLGADATERLLRGDFDDAYLSALPFSLTVTNPHLPDNPLVYVSRAFSRMTKYDRSAIIGQNCRFLQGEDTEIEAIGEIRDAIYERREVNVDIYNYRATGEGFWNRLHLAPMLDVVGNLQFYVGIQYELDTPPAHAGPTAPKAKLIGDLQNRMKNHLALVVSMVRLQSRARGAEHDYDTLVRRIEALQLLYQELAADGVASQVSGVIQLGAYVSRIAALVTHRDARGAAVLEMDVDQVVVSTDMAGPIGVILSEIMTNSLRHAFDPVLPGTLSVELKRIGHADIRLRISDDGRGMPADVNWPAGPTLGGRIVSALVDQIGGQLIMETGPSGTVITLDVPLTSSIRV
ncbi:MAG: PAS domain-containing protein [Pseudomonadota bacterium]